MKLFIVTHDSTFPPPRKVYGNKLASCIYQKGWYAAQKAWALNHHWDKTPNGNNYVVKMVEIDLENAPVFVDAKDQTA